MLRKLLAKSRDKEDSPTVIVLDNNIGKTVKEEGFIRFVCISDTHSFTDELQLPAGDVLLHAGDFTQIGLPEEVDKFNNFLGKQKEKYKDIIVIAGNHDLSFELENEEIGRKMRMLARPQRHFDTFELEEYDPRKFLTNCTYIEDQAVVVEGYHIYGSPWQPEFGGWAFNLKRGNSLVEKWSKIPIETEILITHGPPLGHGDKCFSGVHAGCTDLLSFIQRKVKPIYHLFGHIHEGYGTTTDGVTTYINASICTLQYKPTNLPIVFDLPIKS